MKTKGLMIGMLLMIGISAYAATHAADDGKPKKAKSKVLIIGLPDNVKSNYYFDEKIAEETGMAVDSINQQFNAIISNNIAEALPNSTCTFMPANDEQAYQEISGKIDVKGEGEYCSSNLTKLPLDKFQQALNDAQASHLLVINQHYLKRQEKPMRTVFHIVSYTLYDSNKKEILADNQFYTAMKLEPADRMKKISRKSAAKIASSIEKTLTR